MADQESLTKNEQAAAARGVQNELLLLAASTLRSRYDGGGTYADLSPSAATELSELFSEIARTEDDAHGVDREEAIALAHRLVDDDHPELSPLWPPDAPS